jgi:hypothetical protein
VEEEIDGLPEGAGVPEPVHGIHVFARHNMQRHINRTEPALRFAEGLGLDDGDCRCVDLPRGESFRLSLAKSSAFLRSAKSLRYGRSPTRQ